MKGGQVERLWGGVGAPTRPIPEEGQGVDVRRYLAILKRYKWLVVAGLILGTGGGLAAARLVEPVYEAQLTIWIDGASRNSGMNQGPIVQGQLFDASDWTDLLRSYTVLDYTVSQLRLYIQPKVPADSVLFAAFTLRERFRPGTYRLTVNPAGQTMRLMAEGGQQVQEAALGDSVGGSLGFNWVPPRATLQRKGPVEFTVVKPRDAAANLRDRLSVGAARDGNFMRVTIDDTDPVRAATILNTVAQRYVTVATDLKREKLAQLANILNDQLRQAEQHLRESEGELQSFRVRTITEPQERATPVAPGLTMTENPVLQSYFNMKIQLESLRRDREAIERVLPQPGDSGVSVEALEGVGAVQGSSELMAALKDVTEKRAQLRALREKYTDENPAVEKLSGELRTMETSTIPALARGVLADLKARERVASELIGSASQELQQIPPRAIQEARLQRDVNIASTLYTTLQSRYEEAKLAELSSVPDVRVLDAAVAPQRPVKNRAPQLLMLGLVGGLGLGVVGALGLGYFDRKVRYPEQVTNQLGLPILGVVPYFAARNGKSNPQPVIEALRGIRLNVGYAYGAAGPLVVTITSPGSGDGKSFVASNLALSFADAGYKTLLIDADTRRGALHRTLKCPRKPGLTDVVAGRVPLAGAIRPTDTPMLEFLPSGSRSNASPELIGSRTMTQLVTSLRSSYDAIILDSPPLGAGVDAFALAAVTGNLVVVLRTGTTDREMAETKLGVLDRLPVRILGAVMNGVREWGSYEYYSYYLSGYEAHDEAEGTDHHRPQKPLLSRGA